MQIHIPILQNSVYERSFTFYRNIVTIIKHSDLELNSQKHAIDRLNQVYDEFLQHHTIDVNELQIFLSKAFAITHCIFKENNIDLPFNTIKRYNSSQDCLTSGTLRGSEDIPYMLIVRSAEEVKNPSLSGGFVQSVKHSAITLLTNDLTNEWLKILEPKQEDRPVWFQELPLCQRNIFVDLVNLWVRREDVVAKYSEEKPKEFDRMPTESQLRVVLSLKKRLDMRSLNKMNLGEIFGVQSGVHVLYPGIRMAYTTSLDSFSSPTPEDIKLFRRSFFCRLAIPSVITSDKNEQYRITKYNIEQCILHEIAFHFSKLSKLYEEGNMVIPVLFQYAPSNHGFLPQEMLIRILRKALDTLNESLSKPVYCKKLISDNSEFIKTVMELNMPGSSASEVIDGITKCKNIKFDVLTITQSELFFKNKNTYSEKLSMAIKDHLCNAIESGILVDDKPISKENTSIPKKIIRFLEKKEPEKFISELKELPDDTSITYLVPSIKLGLDAYIMFLEIDDHINDIEDNSILSPLVLEKNAYLEIAFSSIGMTFICCENGCNGTSPLSLAINSLRAYYIINGNFPNICIKRDDFSSENRKEFNKILSAHILEGYCQLILDKSTKGCLGISNFRHIFGDALLNAVVEKLEEIGVYRTSDYINEINNAIAELENANFLNDLNTRKTVIQDEIKKYNSIDKTKETIGEVKTNPLKNYLIPNSDEIIGNKTYLAQLNNRVNKIFNLNSEAELFEKIEKLNTGVAPTLKSTASKIRNFKSKFSDTMKGLDDS